MLINKVKEKIISILSLQQMNSFLFGMLGAISVLIISQLATQKNEIGTVNVTGIVNQFIKSETDKNVTPDVMKKDVKEFGKSLEENLRKLSQKNHLVLFPSEAVISGAPDYTQIVRSNMKSDYQNNNGD